MLYALAAKELKLLLRDVHGLAVLFLMPTMFILIMALAMQNALGGGSGPELTVAIDAQDGSAAATHVIEQLRQNTNIRVVAAGNEHDFRLQLPAGFGRQLLQAPDDPDHPLLTWSSAPTVLPQARALFSGALLAAVTRAQSRAIITDAEHNQGVDLSRLRRLTDTAHWHIEAHVGSGAAVPSAVQQSVPGWLVFAMFFVVVPLASVFITEREQGTDLRLRALQVPAWQLLLARLPPYGLLNMLQLLAMLAVGIWLVPLLGGEALTLGHHPTALLGVAGATSLAAIGLALLVATIARTPVQAFALGGTLNLVFAALGGIMVPKMVMPASMQQLTIVSPMAWALDAFWDILLRGGNVLDALAQCGALSAFGLACVALAALLYHRQQIGG